MKKVISGAMLMLMLLGMLISASNIGLATSETIELAYDDGEADQGEAMVANTTTGWGVKFSHPDIGAPYIIEGVSFYIFMFMYDPVPLRLFVYLQRENSDFYDKVLELIVNNLNEGWNYVNLTSYNIITSRDFIVGFNWVVDNDPFLGADVDTLSRSGSFQTAEVTSFEGYDGYFNYMIRAYLSVYPFPDDSPPEWRNQRQNASVIPQGGYISLEAEGLDETLLSHAMLSTNETGAWKNETTYAFLWRQEAVFGFDNFGTATYKDGVLYAPSKGNNQVYAVNASNGEIIWNVTVRQCDASPTIDGDVIYVGECCGPYGEHTPFPRALALNRTTGEIIWQFIEPNDCEWVGSPLVNGDSVYFTTFGSGVYALNKTNGEPIWHRADIGTIVCSVAYHDGVIFVSAYDPPGQYALNATTGETIWHKNYGASWDSSPVVYNGMVIQVTFDTTTRIWSTYVLNETTGELLRKFEGKGSPSTPLVYNNKIVIPSNDWRIWAFDIFTGEELWHTVELHNGVLQDYSYCSPALAGGAIYYQALNGTFYIINAGDGTVLWSYDLGLYGFGSPSIGDGCVFITNDFALYAFRIGPGSGNWPMFCCNNLHQSISDQGVEYIRYPLTEPKCIKEANRWVNVKFIWCNRTVAPNTAIAWRIYFFDYAGNVNVTDTLVFYIRPLIHNVAVMDIKISKTIVGLGFTAFFDVEVSNTGDFTQTFNVIAYANTTIIEIKEITLLSGTSTTITFTWNTTGFAKGNYIVWAHAEPVMGEAYLDDNTLIDGAVLVAVPCDITGSDGRPDGICDMRDIGYICTHFMTTPSSQNWDPNADVTGFTFGVPDNIVDMHDIGIACKNYMKIDP